jgi:deazaflavin-dependent oxidoreductase (nitroreductase family)
MEAVQLYEPKPTAFLRPKFSERLFNRLFGLFVGLGLGLRHNYLLQVSGRRTGRLYSTPVNILDYEGRRFLVAPRGETQWVRNARSSGQIWLKKGRVRQSYRVREIGDAEKPRLLKTYLDRFTSTVQRYFPIAAGSPPEGFSDLTSRYPVFEMLPQ